VIPQPTAPIDPSGPYPGAGPEYKDPFRNFKVSDVPSNYDYCFRAGIFCGDYESIAVSHGQGNAQAVVLFYGRSKRPFIGQAGRWREVPVAARPQPGVRAVGRLLRQLQRK
jgi:hypothetical protein